MKRIWKNITIALLSAALILPAAVQAQKEDKDKEKKEKKDVEQIIITHKDKGEKMVIEINGDKITVNGKDIKDLKDEDISVHLNKLNTLRAITGNSNNWNFGSNENNMAYFNEDNNRALLGVTTEKTDAGVEVQEVTKESGAAKAGLKVGDIIMMVDNDKITDADNLTKVIRSHKPGDKVTVTYLRDKKEQKATAELGKWKGIQMNNFSYTLPKMETFQRSEGARAYTTPNGNSLFSVAGRPKLGLSVQDTEDGKGVKVLDVSDESNAAKAGVKENDVITSINDKEVNSAEEVAKIVRENKENKSLMLKVNRNGKTQNIEVKFPRKLKTADL